MKLYDLLWFLRHKHAYQNIWAVAGLQIKNNPDDHAVFETMKLVQVIGGKVYGAPD